MKEEIKKKKYLATYWRNDGDWHDIDYDYNPSFIFEADSDEEALEYAIAYSVVRGKKVSRFAENDFIPTLEDFDLEALREIRDIHFGYDVREEIKKSFEDGDKKIKISKENFKELGYCLTIEFKKSK